MKDYQNTDAYQFMTIAFNDLSYDEKVEMLAELFTSMDNEQKSKFNALTAHHEWVLDNNLFTELLYKHEGETKFDNPENWKEFSEDEMFDVAEICNAFDEMCSIRGAEWADTHNWLCGIEGNPWEVGIVEE